MVSKYMDKDEPNKSKRPNINILLNRVRIDQKREKRNKLLFFASASLGLLIFWNYIRFKVFFLDTFKNL